MPTKTAQLMPPLAITEIVHSTWLFKVLFAAEELNLFEPFKGRDKTAAEVAAELSLHEAGVEHLLDGLAAMKLLEKKGSSYSLVEVSRNYLLKDSPVYIGDYLRVAHRSVNASWDSMVECVKTGKPATEVNKQQTAEEFFPALAAAIFPMNYAIAQMVVEQKNLASLPAGAKVLDVAAGSGVWSIPVAESCKHAAVDALDFPLVLDVTKKFAERHGVASQYNYLAGDWRGIELKPEHYDVILVGHLLHSEGEKDSEELLHKLYPALKKGGKLIVAEFMPNDERTAPPVAVLFAINMYLQTTQGCVFSFSELKELLQKTNFQQIERLAMPMFGAESPVVVATKN